MKRKIISILITAMFLAVGCSRRPAEGLETNMEVSPEPEQNVSMGACENIFHPMRLGNQWVYQLRAQGGVGGSGQIDMAIVVAEVDDVGAVVVVRNHSSGKEGQYSLGCEQGAILNFPFVELNAVFAEANAGVDVQYESGVFMPSEEDFIAGEWKNKWTTHYRINGEVEGRYNGDPLRAAFVNSPVKLDWEVVSTGGNLQVPAGQFNDVVQISRKAEIEVTSLEATLAGNRVKLGTKLTLVTNLYYAPGVGLLKQDFESAGVRVFGLNVPIQAAGTMELVSYHLAE